MKRVGEREKSMKKILVVVDMQNDFVDGALGTSEAVGIVDRVADKIKNFDGKIFVTLDTHHDNYMETAEGKKLPVPHCIKPTDGWQLNEKIKAALEGKDDTILEKGTFGSVELPDEIRNVKGSDDLEIEFLGLCTDICVVSNVLLVKAHFPEETITVDAGCCAGVTPESHKAALETMKMCQITVIGE